MSYWLLFLQESAVSLRSLLLLFKAFNSQLLLPDSSFPCIITVTCKPHDSSSDELQYYAPQVGIHLSFLRVIKCFMKTFSCLKTGLRSKLFLKSWHLGDTKVASEHDCNGKNAQREEIRSSPVCRQHLLSRTGLSLPWSSIPCTAVVHLLSLASAVMINDPYYDSAPPAPTLRRPVFCLWL